MHNLIKTQLSKCKYLFVLILFTCSSNDDSVTTNPPDGNGQLPVAVNDAYNALEDTELLISTLLQNDTIVNNARITSINETTTNNGMVEDNRNGTYSYYPAAGFVGVDTFNYTICDTENSPNCSFATVTLMVEDEGSPTANDDQYQTVENNSITINSVLENDTLTDDASIFSVDNTNTFGIVELANGEIIYTPANGFLGNDTFTYTICDDDSPDATCSLATVTVEVLEALTFNIPAELMDYYQDLTFSANADLNYAELQDLTVTQHTTILSYGERHNYLYQADEDEGNTDNVILMYSGESRYWEEYTSNNNSYPTQTFNTEHVYPQSKLSSDDAVTDLHHLRSCDANVNENRSNYSFVNGSGTYGLIDTNTWYPGDEWKGDVARMILYLNIRYQEVFNSVGTLELFLQWNVEDPVSSFEIQRNNIIMGAQGNRNPFIDNPYLATLIWGGSPAENTWE